MTPVRRKLRRTWPKIFLKPSGPARPLISTRPSVSSSKVKASHGSIGSNDAYFLVESYILRTSSRNRENSSVRRVRGPPGFDADPHLAIDPVAITVVVGLWVTPPFDLDLDVVVASPADDQF
jgi:hypothetical protein